MSKEEKNELIKENLKKKIKELSALYEVGKSITSTLQLDAVLNLITKKAAQIMEASACSLRLLNEAENALVLRSAYGLDNSFLEIKRSLKVGESIAGRVIQNKRPYVIGDLDKEEDYKFPHLAKQKGLHSLLTVPLIVERSRAIGVLSIYNQEPHKYNSGDVLMLSMFASQAAIAITNARLYEEAKNGYLNTIRTLSNIIDAKDSHTFGHSERVMIHSVEIANELKLSDYQKEMLKYASLLHDIGKIGIDVGILRKPSKLSNEEWDIMSMHPIMGSGIVEQIGVLSRLAPIILRHHERYDGKGYPGNLKKDKIPLEARILAVSDAYESMISDRPYRKALPFQKAKEELLKCAGSQFDPKIVKAFVTILNRKNQS